MTSNPSKYVIYHSQNGYTDNDVMHFYLHQLQLWTNSRPCVLILDRYTSHTSESTKNIAKNLGIRLVYIPTSATDLYQPLDKRIFGVMKSSAGSNFNKFVFTENRAYTKSEAADLFINTWNRLSSHVILSAWDEDEQNENQSDSSSSSSDFENEEALISE